MTWPDRQRQMLQAMGLRLWAQDVALPAAADPVVDAVIHTPVALPAAVLPPAAAAAGDRLPPVPAQIMDWPALRAAVAVCQACSLGKSRQQTVFGSGHPQAHWLIVGDAPSAQEDATGEAFAGPSGQLLDAMLQALGLSRQAPGDPAHRVFVTNALKCRPPANRNPQTEEMLSCAPFLQRQIELLQPRIILAMGRFAAQALLRDDRPLGQLRGRVHRCAGRPLVVTYHPSYLLRSPGEKAKAWADLCLAAESLHSVIQT